MHLYWTSLPTLEEGTWSSSFDSHAGSFSTRNFQAGIFHDLLCDYTKSRTFSSTLRSSPRSAEVTTQLGGRHAELCDLQQLLASNCIYFIQVNTDIYWNFCTKN